MCDIIGIPDFILLQKILKNPFICDIYSYGHGTYIPMANHPTAVKTNIIMLHDRANNVTWFTYTENDFL